MTGRHATPNDPHGYIAGARIALLIITHALAALLGFLIAIPKG